MSIISGMASVASAGSEDMARSMSVGGGRMSTASMGESMGATPTPGGGLQTPAPGSFPSKKGGNSGGAPINAQDAAARRIAAKEKKKLYKERAKEALEKQKSAEDKQIIKKDGFHDRAAERRKDEMKLIKELEDFKMRSAEESKFLGGTEAYTHLVKGLDTQLLQSNRIREKQEARKARPIEVVAKPKVAKPKSEMAKNIEHMIAATLHPHQIGFQRNLAKMHDRLYSGEKVKNATQQFLPGRTYYIYPTDLYDLTEEPTYGSRSKDECPVLDPKLRPVYAEPGMLQRFFDIFALWKENKRRKKQGKDPLPTYCETMKQRAASSNGARSSLGLSSVLGRSTSGLSSVLGDNKGAGDDYEIFEGVGSFDDFLKANLKGKDGISSVASVNATGVRTGRSGGTFDELETLAELAYAGKDGDDFIPSKTYIGSKPGWIFTTKEKGTGYYQEEVALGSLAALDERYEKARVKKARAKALQKQLNEGTMYDDDYDGGEKYVHTKETMEAQVKAEEIFDNMTAKQKARFEAKATKYDTEASKAIGSKNRIRDENKSHFKTVDDEMKAIERVQEKGSLKRFNDYADETAQATAKRKNMKFY